METFIHKVIDYAFRDNSLEQADKLCFVFPNRRAGLYFRMYMSDKYNKNLWAPGIFSAEDFIARLSGYEIIDSVSLLFKFYEIYKKLEGDKAQPLEDVMNWGPLLLQDYNDADMYLANAEELFAYLSEAKAISRWELKADEIPEHVKNYLQFYTSLGKYYAMLKTELLSQNMAYQGMAFRATAESIERIAEELPWSKIYFCGFNALTVAEEKIIFSLIDKGKAQILFDSDEYYFNDPVFEAGYFLRKIANKSKSGDFLWNESNFRDSQKTIHITGVSGSVGQARYVGSLLSEMNLDEKNLHKTAVVLADESLLIPMVYSIPENIRDMNITMGYKLSLSPLSGFYKAITEMHLSAQRYSNLDNIRFYYKDILAVLNHHFITYLKPELPGSSELSLAIRSSNKVIYSQKDIFKKYIETDCPESQLLHGFFADYRENPQGYVSFLEMLTSCLKKSFSDENESKNNNALIYNEYLYSFALIIKKIKDILNETSIITNFGLLHNLLKFYIDSTSLPFYGEPLKGLQIMGMLETRNLDFENVILLSVNEGMLPSAKGLNSFIPFDIRTEFGLPTYKDKESIFAYHFYRLLQRAKNIHIVYNTITDSLSGGEKSRFLLQLKQELPKYTEHVSIIENTISPSIAQSAGSPIKIFKTPEIIAALKDIAEKGFSPTALSTYVSCPLKFYFQYIAKVKEPDEISEAVDAATLGSVVHDVLYNLFEPLKGKVIDSEFLKKMYPSVELYTKNSFENNYKGGDIETGKNLLMFKVVVKMLQRYIKREISRTESDNEIVSIDDLEKPMEYSIMIDSASEKFKVRIKGIADRIDRHNGIHRIVDYKTGNTPDKNLKIDNWDELLTNPEKQIALQLLIYCWIYLNSGEAESVYPCIISMRKLDSGEKQLKLPTGKNIVDREITENITEIIVNILKSVFDSTLMFTQTDNEDVCEFCTYSKTCKTATINL